MAGHTTHQAYIDRLNAQRAVLNDPDWVTQLGGAVSKNLDEVIPNRMTLKDLVTITSGVRGLGTGKLSVGIGPKEKIGRDEAAPKGTIKQFLADEKAKGHDWRVGAKDPQGFRINAVFPMAKEYAWWNLPFEAKALLEQARKDRGQFGGTPDQWPYFYVQDQSLVAWRASAQLAGLGRLRNRRWVSRAFALYEQQDKPQILEKFRAALKRGGQAITGEARGMGKRN